MNTNEKRAARFQTESEILAEFEAGDAELARQLLSLRQAPGAALQQRIQAIPQPAAEQTREAAPPADRRPARRGWGQMLRPLVVGMGAAILLAVALLAFSPGFRAAAAQAVGEIRQLLGSGIATGPEGISTFRPAPPFNVKQPDYLPEGFRLVAQRYNPGPPDPQTGQGGVGVTVKEVRPQPAGPTAQEAVEQDRGTEPYIILVYESPHGQHVQLFERAAQPDEALPAGESRTIGGQPATLQRDSQTLELTWVDAGTWIELEGMVSEAELLRIAEGLVTTQTPDSVVEGEAGEIVSPIGKRELAFCDEPDVHMLVAQSGGLVAYDPRNPRLGEVRGQQFKASVIIELRDPETSPDPESVALGGQNIKNMREEVLEPALAALQDPTLPMQRLPYPSLRVELSYESDPPCFTPAHPDEQGYVVIEVWDNQVNVGYGGAGDALIARALKALEKWLQKVAQTPASVDDALERPAPVVPTSDKPIPAATREALDRAVRKFFALPYCNPDHRVPSRPRVREVKGQQLKGWVTIQLWDHRPVGEYETLGYSVNAENMPKDVRQEVLEPALAALRDPTVPMQRLSYPSLSFRLSDSGECKEPDPNEEGYVVIEVWDDQVNVGYGGEGAILKERAIRALEQELQKRR